MNLIWTRNVQNKILGSDCQQAIGQMRFMAELDVIYRFFVLHLKEEIKTTLAYDSIFDH
jgi:hypothetical protein